MIMDLSLMDTRQRDNRRQVRDFLAERKEKGIPWPPGVARIGFAGCKQLLEMLENNGFDAFSPP